MEEMQFILSNATPLLKFQTSTGLGALLLVHGRQVRRSFDASDLRNIRQDKHTPMHSEGKITILGIFKFRRILRVGNTKTRHTAAIPPAVT